MIVKIEPDTLVGKRYDADTYHCWHFIEDCIDVPKLYDIAVATVEDNINENLPYFIEIEDPFNYCIALLGKKHIGIYKDGYIYHNDRDSVKAEPLRTMKRKYVNIRYFDKAII